MQVGPFLIETTGGIATSPLISGVYVSGREVLVEFDGSDGKSLQWRCSGPAFFDTLLFGLLLLGWHGGDERELWHPLPGTPGFIGIGMVDGQVTFAIDGAIANQKYDYGSIVKQTLLATAQSLGDALEASSIELPSYLISLPCTSGYR